MRCFPQSPSQREPGNSSDLVLHPGPQSLLHTRLQKMDGAFHCTAVDLKQQRCQALTTLTLFQTLTCESNTGLLNAPKKSPHHALLLSSLQTKDLRHKELKKPGQSQELAGGSPTGQYPHLLPTKLTTSYQRLYTHRNVSRRARVWVLLRPALQRAQG